MANKTSSSQVALVTGASSGIGWEFAKILAQDGYDLVLVARNRKKLEELKSQIEGASKVKVAVLAKDLSHSGASTEVFQEVTAMGYSVDVLVNNAGFGQFGKFVDNDWDKEAEMIHLNVLALTHLTKLFLPSMIKKGSGQILNVASTAAFQPGPLMAVYYATKAYVLSFSEAISNELKGTGVTVTTLCPGPTESGFLVAANLGQSKLFQDRKIPSSLDVAQYGYRAMKRQKGVVIYGKINWMIAQSVPFMPRKLVASVVRKIQEVAGR